MGIEGESLYGAVRVSFSRDHTPEDMATAVERIIAAVRRIRELS
jgi:cysteine desulfurase